MKKNDFDILSQYSALINYDDLRSIREVKRGLLMTEHWRICREALLELPEYIASHYNLELECLEIGSEAELDEKTKAKIAELIKILIPWRKGPFSLFGATVDAEWRSDLKWDRIYSAINSVSGKRVLDIGCNNGYYMFKLASGNPELVLGCDPSDRFYYQFQLINHFLGFSNLQYELLGIEHANLFPEFFDTILCMGVLYHRRDPLTALKGIYNALAPGGQLILESQSIPGTDPVALFPKGRYAKARNVYFVPTATCLENMLQRTGFSDIKLICESQTTSTEQRKTEYAPFESLSDFMDPNDPNKTIEGYPGCWRVVFSAIK